MRRDNAALDSAHHEQEKVTNQLRTRLAVLEQELHDKQQVKEPFSDEQYVENLILRLYISVTEH